MTSITNMLSSDEQKNLNTLLSALPEQYGAVDCSTYLTYRPIIQSAIPLIAKLPAIGSKVATALQFLVGLADAVCPAPGARVKSSGGFSDCPDCSGARDTSGLELLKAAGILHPDATLDKIVEVQRVVSKLPTSGSCVVIGQMVYSANDKT